MLPCSVTAIAGIFSFDGLIEQLVDAARAVEQRVLGVQVQVDELRHATVERLIRSPMPITPIRSSTAASS